jgi:hypothetical protein
MFPSYIPRRDSEALFGVIAPAVRSASCGPRCAHVVQVDLQEASHCRRDPGSALHHASCLSAAASSLRQRRSIAHLDAEGGTCP